MIKCNISLAFKKSDKKSLLDRLISLVTKSNFTHVELLIDNDNTSGTLWISSRIGGVHVVTDMTEDASLFTVVSVGCFELTEEQYTNIINWVHKQSGKKYDYKGILLSQFIKIGANDNNKWFCSELVTKILQLFGSTQAWDLMPSDVSPGMLFDIYSK